MSMHESGKWRIGLEEKIAATEINATDNKWKKKIPVVAFIGQVGWKLELEEFGSNGDIDFNEISILNHQEMFVFEVKTTENFRQSILNARRKATRILKRQVQAGKVPENILNCIEESSISHEANTSSVRKRHLHARHQDSRILLNIQKLIKTAN